MLTILDKTFVPFIDRDTLQSRIAELAEQINRDYANRRPLIVGVLNGAVLFTADLLKNLTIDCEITFIRVASYDKTHSTGQIKQILGLSEVITGRDLIVIEDIVDTGLTMQEVLRQLNEKEPASIAIATLLFKPAALQTPLDLTYVGFEIDNQFVVGYGLDYDGLGRNTQAIFVLEQP
ncbi:hypoxanthine phosphoribosyltransferase [Fibrella aestuarina BUZ 2]|uniref:Hypoxanthine phosphoribosyltransferase n=1 Tax=Fibrella aestuarina BUZ 2 TaxID=1166018 RepID=I0K3I3_9BACT|nr:hypoxanthine phosphoribosyltransferase [Fibrella aestuarina]CCG98686.1 hypoxanthine phosphoribosyltransferase [Fibrella aestuarina BUZ 2]